ncbi:hypothetical protein HOLleu_32454 [Holothuria leucospilota]|uniref:Uncharacterized protein n=1 Tax=Holothuria leucospilota TaxID=206669 RepID=A0A9Q1BIQ4_HOLLE|nr:hypothetical protein HOLleu_32454 [Holothuria leucospilota]
MFFSVLLMTLLTSGYLSEAKRITVKDFPPKIPKLKPENMRQPQPFHCTASYRENKDDKVITASSWTNDGQTGVSKSPNQNMPRQENAISHTKTDKTGSNMTPFSMVTTDDHSEPSKSTNKGEVKQDEVRSSFLSTAESNNVASDSTSQNVTTDESTVNYNSPTNSGRFCF